MERKSPSFSFDFEYITPEGQVETAGAASLSEEAQALLREIHSGSDKALFFTTEERKKELVTISSDIVDYSYDHNISSIVLLDRAARPAYLGILEAWNRKYPQIQKPSINFINPTGFIDLLSGIQPTDNGVPQGLEVMIKSMIKGNQVGDFFTTGRTLPSIHHEFSQSYSSLRENRKNPMLLFDTCIHSGTSMMPLLKTLEREGFSDIHIGVASDEHNYSGIEPDLIVLDRLPQGGCYPFSADILVDRTFSSVTSSSNNDDIPVTLGRSVRQEISKVLKEAPDRWYGIEG